MLVGISGLLISVLVWRTLLAREHQIVRARFSLDAEQRVGAIQREFAASLESLRALTAFYDGSELVKRDEFNVFTESLLERQRGIHALGWSPLINAAQRGDHEESTQQEGYEGYRISQRSPAGELARAGDREEFLPVHFLEPEGRDPLIMGLDLTAEPRFLGAIRRSREAGDFAASGPVDLARGSDDRTALIAFAPVYSKGETTDAAGHRPESFAGVYLALLSVGTIVEDALSYFEPVAMDLYLFDPSLPDDDKLVYAIALPARGDPLTPLRAPPESAAAAMDYFGKPQVADRRWVAYCVPSDEYLAAARPRAATAGLALGLLATGLLTGYLLLLGQEAMRRESLVAERTAELARSNADLEQFAYAASHDLQEPLRMVASYVGLLGKRYRGRLDQDADDFIEFAVDGAKRMQELIEDLLTYSRVGTRGKAFEPTDCNRVVDEVIQNLRVLVTEQGALVTRDDLPVINADHTQLAELIQNLVGNAIKFRGEEPPCVHIAAEKSGGQWHFSVEDNGIGIDPKYNDRIFAVFQRLHTRREYPGTGIGLAVCRRIVERHGGRIWFESKPGDGTIFRFTLSDQEDAS